MRRALFACAIAVACCAAPEAAAPPERIVLSEVDTLISAESALVASAVDLDVGPAGNIYLADWRANQIVRLDRWGRTTTLGRGGQGPGEFQRPSVVRVTDDGIVVVDAGNLRIQRLRSDGALVSTTEAPRLVLQSTSHLLADGTMLIGTNGSDSCLATVFSPEGMELRRIGVPIVQPPEISDFYAMNEKIDRGEIPDDLRNQALVAASETGVAWIALVWDGLIQRYGEGGNLEWSLQIAEPEMDAIRARFFQRNAEDSDPNRLISLAYFRDVFPEGERLWVLMDSQESDSALVLVIDADGSILQRIEIPGAGGRGRLAVDRVLDRLLIYTSHNAQLLAVGPARVVAP